MFQDVGAAEAVSRQEYMMWFAIVFPGIALPWSNITFPVKITYIGLTTLRQWVIADIIYNSCRELP